MSPLSIEYFVVVAKHGSLSRAALELGIEQSTITRHIGKLESDVGVRLFHRSGRGVVLTDAGQLFLSHARDVVTALSQARVVAGQLSGTGPGKVVIAAQPTIALQSFSRFAQDLSKRFPSTRLRFMEGLGHQLMNWLVEGEIDLALLYVPTQAHVVDFDELLKEPLYCVASPDVTLPEDGMDVRSMLARPMVLPSTQHGLRSLMLSLAQQENLPLNLLIECDASIAVTKQLVEGGHACTILPLAAVARELQAGRLKACPVDDPRMVRTVGIATAKNRPMVDSNWEIRQLIRQAVIQLVEAGEWPGAQCVEQAFER